MNESINPVSIFLPVLAMVLLAAIAFVRMGIARTRGLKEAPRDPTYFRAHLGPPEPEAVVVAVRHYGNLFEAPVLFYPACIIAFELATVSTTLLIWAWGYTAMRYAQSIVHLTYNNPLHRGLAFTISWVFLCLQWLTVATSIINRL